MKTYSERWVKGVAFTAGMVNAIVGNVKVTVAAIDVTVGIVDGIIRYRK